VRTDHAVLLVAESSRCRCMERRPNARPIVLMHAVQPRFRPGGETPHGTGPDALVRRAHVERTATWLDEPEDVVALFDELVEPLFESAQCSLRELPTHHLGPAPRSGFR